jgi:hypothetical protein
VKAEEVGVGGDEKLSLFPLAAQAKEHIGPVHLVDPGNERTDDLPLQFFHDAMNNKKVHNLRPGLHRQAPLDEVFKSGSIWPDRQA